MGKIYRAELERATEHAASVAALMLTTEGAGARRPHPV